MVGIRLKTVASIAFAGIVGASCAHAASWSGRDGDERRLEGTWVFQISLQNCSSGAPIGQPFLSLLTFNSGGTMTETTANSMFYPAVRGPGHGVWERTGPHTYRATSLAFVTVNGALARTQTITQTIKVKDDNSLKTTSASVKFFQPDGTPLSTGCAAATGERLRLEEDH